MLVGIDHELQVHVVPAGEGAGGLADVGLAVVAHAHGEQLHDLAGEVLVGRALHVHAGIEEGQHGRVFCHGDHQLTEIAGALRVEQLQLVEQLAVVAHLALVHGEMPMPEQRHLLLQRRIAGHHAVGPPVGHAVGFEHAGAQPVEELVDDGLQRAVAAGFDLHAQGLARGLGHLGHRWTAGGKRFQPRVVNAGVVEGLKMAVVDILEMHQVAHGAGDAHGFQRLNLLRRSAKTGALQQVGGSVVVPAGLRQGAQIVLPVGRGGGAGHGEHPVLVVAGGLIT